MVYNITVKDKSCRVKRLLTRSKKKESGIVAVHLKSNKTAYNIDKEDRIQEYDSANTQFKR